MSTARAQPDVLDDLAALGPFFAVEAHRPGAAPVLPWRPLADLITPPLLQERIGRVSSVLADRPGRAPEDIELRVAASVTQLGLVARFVAPPLAAQTLGQPLDLRLGGLWGQDTLGGPLPLSVPQPARVPASSPSADQIDALFGQVLTPITVATAALAPVSDRVLWGNVASAINGAAGQIARGRPELASAAWATAAEFFRHPELGTEPDPPGPSFRRSSCCLIYRLEPGPAAAVCGDCVLGGRP